MRQTTAIKAVLLVWTALLAAGSGCEGRDYTYPLYQMEWDTDTGTDTDTDPGTGGDGDGDTDTDACDDNYLDDLGRCIRYVDWDAEETVCGTDWDSAFTAIQDGIDSAYAAAQMLGSCEVWVAAGTYRSWGGAATDTIYMRQNVQIFGGFAGVETDLEQRDVAANETILDGRDELGLGASYHVVMGADAGALDGFTVTGGNANGDSPHHRGGGIYTNSTETIVRNCTFRGNRGIDGGAAFLYDSAPRVEACRFEENVAENGGAIFVLNGAAQISDVVLEHNTAIRGGGIYLRSIYGDCAPTFAGVVVDGNTAQTDGGGVFVENCHPELYDAKIQGNTALGDGGGLAGEYGSALLDGALVSGNAALGSGGGLSSFETAFELVGSRVVENSAAAHGGGLRLAWSDSVVEASLIAANTAGGDGGGVFVELDFPEFLSTLITGNRGTRGGGAFNGNRAVASYVNTVFHGNVATELAGGAYNADLSEVDLFNDVLWGDVGGEIYDEKGSETELAFCVVAGGYPLGVHVIDADPRFAAPGAWADPGTPDDPADDAWGYGDYHLLADSPCIDEADDDTSPAADADGNDWTDVADAGLPDVAADIGAYDYQM